MNIRQRLEDKITSILAGAPIKTMNDGKPVDMVTIQYKDMYFFVAIDEQSGNPTGDFSWSHDPTMNPTVLIRDIWVAKEPK